MRFRKTNKRPDRILDHIAVEPGAQSYVHNYYTPEAFFEQKPSEGVIEDYYGARVLRVDEDFIVGLSRGLESEVGEQSACDIMYKSGFRWGTRGLQSFTARMQHEFECEFDKLGMGFMLEEWWWPYQIQGWGTWRYDFTQGKQGLIFIDLFESAVAKSLGDVGHVVCHFYAGLFGATFAGLSGRDLGTIEIQCYGMGEDYCKFLVSSAKRVNAASFWREEGATTKDIVKKLQTVD